MKVFGLYLLITVLAIALLGFRPLLDLLEAYPVAYVAWMLLGYFAGSCIAQPPRRP